MDNERYDLDAKFAKYAGKRIMNLVLNPEGGDGGGSLVFTMDDGSRFEMWDNGQSCCESRYMTCDDDLAAVLSARLLAWETQEGPDIGKANEECHDTMFLYIRTSLGDITACTHNEHNGYYGGFLVDITDLEPVALT